MGLRSEHPEGEREKKRKSNLRKEKTHGGGGVSSDQAGGRRVVLTNRLTNEAHGPTRATAGLFAPEETDALEVGFVRAQPSSVGTRRGDRAASTHADALTAVSARHNSVITPASRGRLSREPHYCSFVD